MERGRGSEASAWESPAPPRSRPRGPVYLGADPEVMVGDELWARVVARVEPGVEGAEGHARERQREGQEAPGAGCSGERQG